MAHVRHPRPILVSANSLWNIQNFRGRLLDRLATGDSHLPAAADKAGQTDPEFTGCSYADFVLLPAMRAAGAFVDQE